MWRLTGVGAALWGVALLWRGHQMWKGLTGRSPGDLEAAAIRVLGIRHLAQGVFEAIMPGRLARTLIFTDLLHAASMLPAAIAGPQRRKPTLLSAAFAASSAIALVRSRRAWCTDNGQRSHTEEPMPHQS